MVVRTKGNIVRTRGSIVWVMAAITILVGGGAGYLIGNTGVHTVTSISVTTDTLVSKTTVTATTSYDYLSASGTCSVGGSYAPCFGGAPFVFNCAAEAATAKGCTQKVVNSLVSSSNYTISVRFPFINATSPQWSNCTYEVTASFYGGYGYCHFTNSTAFVVGEPAPPRP